MHRGAQVAEGFGERLKGWRRRRGFSQLALATEVGVSARHLCFVETGRSKPSVEMIERLADGLEIPLREQNDLLLLAGYAPQYQQHSLDAPELKAVNSVVGMMLEQHEPYPALVLDRYWDLVRMNQAARRLFEPVAAGIAGTLNSIDIFLGHPAVRQMVQNWTELAFHTRERLRAQVRHLGRNDPRLNALLERTEGYLDGEEAPRGRFEGPTLTTQLLINGEQINTISTITAFSGAADVLVDDLRIELVFPADDAAARWFRAAVPPLVPES